MSRKFQVKVVPSKWIQSDGHRLDCGPYLSGAMEARELLKKLQPEPLKTLTTGYKAGVFNGPRFPRNYVDDIKHGVPFLGSTDILDADFQNLPLLSKKQVIDNPGLIINQGWSLITCSGTIGRMAFSRADMEGLAGSQHFMRVIPNLEKIYPGYLYSYLSSRFGIPLVVSGTYGSIIQSIEPEHLIDLPVPRLGAIEQQAHELVQKAANLRVEASSLLKRAGELVNKRFGFPEKLALSHRVFSYATTSSASLMKRMDATYHDAIAQESDAFLAKSGAAQTIESLQVSCSENGRVKQVFVDQEYGVPFLTSGEIFRQRYEPERYLSERLLPDRSEWAIKEGDILIARSGQVGGIIGRGVWADKRFADGAVSVDVLKLSAHNALIAHGYLFAYLCLTDVGYRQLIRTAAGSSIPHISARDTMKLLVPRCENNLESQINDLVWEAGNKRADAQAYEDQARSLVEHAIEEGG